MAGDTGLELWAEEAYGKALEGFPVSQTLEVNLRAKVPVQSK